MDFRSLSVREFGTIYEGLLESRLAVATDDLTVRRIKGHDQYVPAGSDDSVEVDAGGVYLHNRSGVRKATGSYFTKPFAVEHLLDHALEPALDDHIFRLDTLREAHAQARAAVAPAEALFDLISAQRAGACTLPQRFDEATLLKEAATEQVRTAIGNLQPAHFPAAFPEVVLRDNPGFDCLLGNPP